METAASLQSLLYASIIMYVAAKSVFDFEIGKDSLWTRLTKPLYNRLYGGRLRTEQEWQRQLQHNREQIPSSFLEKVIRYTP